MKKVFVLMIFAILVCNVAFAGDLVMATGSEKGVYHKIGSFFLPKQLDGKMTIQCVNTQGSAENVQLLKDGRVQAAMLQMDALILNPDLEVEIVGLTHKEYVHLITRKDGPSSISDFGKNNKIAVGRADSGTQITWNSFCKEDDSYKAVPTVPLAGTIALSKLSAGEIDGIIMVSGLRGGDVMRANENKDFKLSKVDDWDFNDTEYRGKKVYEFSEISPSVYPGLTPGMFAGSVKTITIPAVLVVSSAWAMEHPEDFDRLYDATTRAIPNIDQFVKNGK